MERLIIIGSGPAGLTAAIYAARARLEPLVLAGSQYGGQLMLTTEVENYPGFADGIMGPDLMEAFRKQAERFGARILDTDVTRVDFTSLPLRVWTHDEEYMARSIVVATGASARWLGIPGEERLRGRGVSSCATCDGAFFRNKHIAVVGGGDSAMEEALFLTRFGSKVTVIHRRESLRASKIMAERALGHPKLEFLWNAAVEEAIGEHTLERLRVRNTVTNEASDLAADALFVAIGHVPNTEVFRGQLELDSHGYVVSQDGVFTGVDGVFVGGDVWDIRYRQAVTAAGMGCRAAMEAEKFLEFSEAPTEILAAG
ncbi:MAG TPA: thioredoxin-disulfide reductase [Candidatus Baltobacteraceae bacterium]|nr:thioredoxin-disulfide reductase [Candidatus Baltobacteraceae bacterium]